MQHLLDNKTIEKYPSLGWYEAQKKIFNDMILLLGESKINFLEENMVNNDV